MLWKCCTKFGKLNSGHGLEKLIFFPIQRKAVPRNVQTIIQLHSSHRLANNAQNSPSQASTVCETMNFQMFKLDLEKRSNCQHPLDHPKSKRIPKKNLLLLYWLHQSLSLPVWITTNCGKFWKRREYQITWPASWEICMQVKKQQLELGKEQTIFKLEKQYIKTIYCH